jgi:translocation and assembly module TamB
VSAPRPVPRRWWKYFLIVAGAGLVALAGAAWYITTDSFQVYVRRRLVAEVERITGGRAQIGSFHVVPFRMQVEVRDITVRGSEAASDIPLAHADHLVAQVKVISLLRTQFGFHSLLLEHPVVHIEVAPDGTTNIPVIKALENVSEQKSLEQVFALSIDHLSVQNGELLWADRKLPLDFTANQTGLHMDYSHLHRRYESRFTVGKVDTVFDDCRPFSWMGELDFALTPTTAEIESLKWTSGRSNLRASGRISNFQNPHFEGSYQAHFDLQEAAAILRRRDLSGGVAEFKGSGAWSAEGFGSSGSLAVRDVAWQDDQVGLKKADASGDYALTDQQIKVSKIQGKVLGGSFTGDAQIVNWLHTIPFQTERQTSAGSPGLKNRNPNQAIITAGRASARNAGKEKLPGIQSGIVHLRVRDISLAEVAGALNRPARRLGRFRPAGSAAGSVDAAWRGSVKNSDLNFAFDSVRPEITVANELPVTARIQGRYGVAADELQLSEFRVSTLASRIQASGTISRSTTLQLSVATSDLEEWRPLLAALGAPTDLPFRVDGNAAFNGVVGGSFLSPTLAGTLAADDFEFTVPATSYTPEKEVHWDSLAASIQVSSHNLTMRGGSLRRGETSADFEVEAGLQKGQFTADSPYTARANLHNVDVASTAALAGFNHPVSGTADVSVQIAGTRANPHVQGHIHASHASAYGESIEAFEADLHIANGETTLNNVHLQHQDASIAGMAAYTPSSRGFHLDLAGKNFDLSRVRQIHLDRLPVEGRADFLLEGSGTLDAPVINASVQVHNLVADRELEGGLNLEGATSNGELRIRGSSAFGRGTLALEGRVQMHGDYPADITAHLDRMDLDPVWRAYLGGQLTGHSAVGGAVTLRGPLRYPEQWTLNGDLSDIGLDIEYVKLHNQGPVRFSYSAEVAHIEPLHLIGEGTDITGGGSIHFAALRELRLSADGQVDLKLLGGLNPDLNASGRMLIQMNVGGTLTEPLPQGTIRIENGTVNYAGLPSGLSEVNGSLAFTLDHVRIEQLTARTGGGTLDLRGAATRYNRQLNFNLTAMGKDVRLRYPPGVSSTADAELRWTGSPSSSTVSGNVMVTKLAVTPGFDFGSYLQRSRQSVVLAPANSPLDNVKLDVAVHTAPELQMKTAVARLSGDADLRVRGSAARPSVLGRADILEGQATFNGIKFRLERGDITFANPVSIEPQLNMEATTHVRNYDLNVMVTGTPDRLNVNYRSEPPLPKSDIIALLALGRTSEESTQLQQQSGLTPFNDQASAFIINQAINQTVSSRLQKLFGASRVRIDPQGLVTETNPTARGPQVTIEQQFANNISLTYSTNVSQSSQQIIQGEYYFTRNISVVGTRDQNGVVSFDVQVRRGKK